MFRRVNTRSIELAIKKGIKYENGYPVAAGNLGIYLVFLIALYQANKKTNVWVLLYEVFPPFIYSLKVTSFRYEAYLTLTFGGIIRRAIAPPTETLWPAQTMCAILTLCTGGAVTNRHRV
jgi:hypothetical protein